MKNAVFAVTIAVVGWALYVTYPWKHAPKGLLNFIKMVAGVTERPNGDEIASLFFAIGVSVGVAFIAALLTERILK